MNLATEKQLQYLRDVMLEDNGIETDDGIMEWIAQYHELETPSTIIEELTASDCSRLLTHLRQ